MSLFSAFGFTPKKELPLWWWLVGKQSFTGVQCHRYILCHMQMFTPQAETSAYSDCCDY